MRFGEKLSLLRKRRGMTQLELAEELNVSRQAVSRWEQGISNPSTENMVRIGKLLDVSIDTLVNENAQLQTETAVLVVEAEEKKAVERHDKRGILKIVGIVLLVVAAVLVVCIWLAKDTQNPVPMEDINKSEVNVYFNSITLTARSFYDDAPPPAMGKDEKGPVRSHRASFIFTNGPKYRMIGQKG